MPDTVVRVLLVEDNPADIRLVHEMLADCGGGRFDLEFAESLSAGLEKLSARRYDVLLLDLSLPDAHGLNTLTEVQTLVPDLPVVILSGLRDEAVALEAVHNGAQDYLVKGQGDGALVTRALRYAMERKRSEQHLAYLAQYDPLTDLPNRSLFRERLERAVERGQRRETVVALMFLDLDHFKDVNDTLGHDAGDQLLCAAAKRLKECVRHEDTVARLGGDEFTILLESLERREDAATVAEKILQIMREPFTLDGTTLFMSTSIGIATFPADAPDPETLIKHADTALYAAKKQGRSNYQFFQSSMNTMISERMTRVTELRRALDAGEFDVYYQPQCDSATGALRGLEALLRWEHPEHGLLYPRGFIPLLEETGLIVTLGQQVLKTVCAQWRRWRQQGLPPLRIAVNLSPRQFRKQELLAAVTHALEESGMPAHCLQLEVTEGLLIHNTADAITTLQELHSLGVQIVIDDFGTGYSSLNHLRRFPFDSLKVDQSFVHDISADEDNAAIVAAVIQLAHSMRFRVVAEGVEDERQLSILQEQGCDEIQGYYLAKPMTASHCTQWLQGRHPAAQQPPVSVTDS